MRLVKGPIDRARGWPDHQLEQAKNSLQYKGKLLDINRIFNLIYLMDYYLGFLVIFSYIFIVRCKSTDRSYYAFSLFAIIIILANACIMPNFIGQIFRYQLRIMLIPCLAMVLIATDFLNGLRCRRV